MFKSLINLGGDIVNIATAPVKIAAETTRVVTKPLSDALTDIADDFEDENRD